MRGSLLIVSRFLAILAMGALLVGCASSEKPKPSELEPNPSLLGIKQAWVNGLGTIGFALSVREFQGQIFLASSDGMVAAIGADSGQDVWRTKLQSALVAGVGSDGRYAAVVSRDNEVILLDAGKELWRQKLGASTQTAPYVAGGRVFVLAGDRSVAAFDAATGRKLWQQQRAVDPLILGQAGVIFGAGDTLVVGWGGRLVGLNSQSGTIRWDVPIANSRGTNEVERLVDLVAGVSRVGDVACVRAFQSAVGCINVVKGSPIWSKPANGSTGLHGDATTLFGTEGDGKLVAWNRADGERIWVNDRLRFRGLGAPLLVGRSVVVGDQAGLLHFFSREDGSLLQRIPTDNSPIAASPILVGQTLVVVTRLGKVLGFRPD
jgi:outer membrane assembly lipoprotein YfgL